MRKLSVAHIIPGSGGIADYSGPIEAAYELLGHKVSRCQISSPEDARSVAAALQEKQPDLCHFEVGAGDAAIFKCIQKTRVSCPKLVTIHDPGVVVHNPRLIRGTGSKNPLIRFTAKAARKGINKLIGSATIKRAIADPKTHLVYLRSDLAHPPKSFYLPQPTYHSATPSPPRPKTPPVIAFAGYWGRGKGIETLLEAWELSRPQGWELVIAGSAGTADDPYAASIKNQVKAVSSSIRLPGFISDSKMDEFLSGLSCLVLPYWPEVPNGTSAMAMRAAELGVPLIATAVPSLQGELSTTPTTFVPPKDARALSAAIKELAQNPKLARERALETQASIFSRHNWEAVSLQLEKILNQVFGESRP